MQRSLVASAFLIVHRLRGARRIRGSTTTDHAQQESTSLEAPITQEPVASKTSRVVGNSCVSPTIVCKRCPLKTVAGMRCRMVAPLRAKQPSTGASQETLTESLQLLQ